MTPRQDEYCTIPLTKGLFAIVDKEDIERIGAHKWCVSVSGYAVRRTVKVGPTPGVIVYMHREILGFSPDDPRMGDHRNCARLDNRRANLREATSSENTRNQKLKSNNTTGHKGVYLDKRRGEYQVYIKVLPDKRRCFGGFATVEDAAAFRASVLPAFHGEFARQDGCAYVAPRIIQRSVRVPINVNEAIRLRRSGLKLAEIAQRFGVTKQRIWQITAADAFPPR